MDKLIVVSVDSHAQIPPELWPEYLESRYHEFLPSLREEQELYEFVINLVFERDLTQLDVFDPEGVYRAGNWKGLYDLDLRLAEMDREGIAGEYVNNGDGRIIGMFFESGNRVYPLDVCRAGVRAYHRWLYDTFGSQQDRLFLIGAVGTGPCADIDPMLQETQWIADHGFHGTTLPGFTVYPDQPPLSDLRYEPFWALCEERGLVLWIHGGYGETQGFLASEVESAYRQFEAAGRDVERFWAQLETEVFNGELLDNPKPRRAMWQLMFSGVFDRHPDLELVINEARGDWIPATLRYLDAVYAEHRDELPAERSPSEYWHSNCMACLSFVHKSEIPMLHEIGIDRTSFGRDYPHSEGTWPNTREWLRDALSAVPDDEVRMLLGENVIRVLGLDRAKLAEIAERIGPTIADIRGDGREVDPALLAHFDARGGYLKPAEGGARIPEVDALVREDLANAGAGR